MGNFAAIKNMLRKLGFDAVVTSDPKILSKANKIILPGVGSFDYGIENLTKLGLIDVLKKKVLIDNTPILGVCLGMQLLTKSSEEGVTKGLGFIDAATIKFKFNNENEIIKVPNMGWNYINLNYSNSILESKYEKQRFYFVHSYHVVCFNESDILATSKYGLDFVSAFKNKNIYGFQFHPEKSHKYGLEILKNFAELEV
jgi:glutamine amidotransferase